MLESNVAKISLEELQIEPAEHRCEDHVEFGVSKARNEIDLLVPRSKERLRAEFAEGYRLKEREILLDTKARTRPFSKSNVVFL